MLKERLHLVPPSVTDLAEGAMNEKNLNVRENYLQRLRAVSEYCVEALEKIETRRKKETRERLASR